MNLFRHPIAVPRFPVSAWAAVAIVAAMLFAAPTAKAQTSSATLDGTVLDSSNAVVPGATVTLKNEASGDQRSNVSNGEGCFNFAAVQPGSYSLTVAREGFATWTAKGIAISSGDHRNASGIKLKP